MKKLKASANVTLVLAVLSVGALIMQFLALADIAQNKENLKLEWYIVGISLMILGAFIISVFVTLAFLFKNQD
jgi:hypothetical protein